LKPKQFIVLLILSLFFLNSFSQSDSLNLSLNSKPAGAFYFSWGYTRAWFSKSTLHFVDRSNAYHEATGKNNNYDFTIYNATAHDRPDFDKIRDVINITVPQFACHAGYYFNTKNDIGIEVNFDHTKYVLTDWQKVHVKGDFNGVAIDKDTILDPDKFLHFEHTDGANFLCFNFLKRWKFIESSGNFNLGWVVKPGIGMVIPRTDVTLFGERLNNKFHIAGCIAAIETGLRAEFLTNGFFELMAKGSYANYMQVLVLGKGSGKANHSFYTFQVTAQLGFLLYRNKKG
jgi:hypothetical protein